jgi:hypothetical protein
LAVESGKLRIPFVSLRMAEFKNTVSIHDKKSGNKDSHIYASIVDISNLVSRYFGMVIHSIRQCAGFYTDWKYSAFGRSSFCLMFSDRRRIFQQIIDKRFYNIIQDQRLIIQFSNKASFSLRFSCRNKRCTFWLSFSMISPKKVISRWLLNLSGKSLFEKLDIDLWPCKTCRISTQIVERYS